MLLHSDTESVFGRKRPPCAGKGPNDRASSPHTTTVSQQLLLFSDHSLHAARLIIHLLRATQPAFMYITPSLCLSVGPLPFHHTLPLALLHWRRVPGTITWYPARHRLRCVLFTVPTVPFCCTPSSSKIKWCRTQRPRISLLTASVLSVLAFLFSSDVNKRYVCNKRWTTLCW